MSINNQTYAYSPLYDCYVDRVSMVIYKRNNRQRKTEIQESELVPIKLSVNYNGYIMTYATPLHKTVGIWRIYADAFPESVHCYNLHLADPVTFCEIDHCEKGHLTIESNYPENLRWTTPKLNRAFRSNTLDVASPDMTEKERERIMKNRERVRKYREEHIDELRKQDAARKRKYYHERKGLRRQQSIDINIQWRSKAGLDEEEK